MKQTHGLAGFRRQPEHPSIAVWGHITGHNLGDELVVDVLANAIRRRMPDCGIVAISSVPRDTEERHGIAAHPLNPAARAAVGGPTTRLGTTARRMPGARFIWSIPNALIHAVRELPFAVHSYRELRTIDRIVVAGSGQLLDKWRGPWWHPYTTFRWAVLARLAGTEMLYPSVGAGPIDHRLSRLMFRKSLEWASFVSARDRHSADVLRSIGVARELPVCPDMGWAFEVDSAAVRRPRQPTEPAVVGVNPMSHEDPRYWPRGDAARYDVYVGKLAQFVARLLEQGERVLLFSSQNFADAMVAADLLSLLAEQGVDQHPSLDSAIEQTAGVDDLLRAISRCDYVVAGRFHSVLLPTALGIPTIGLAYHEKTCELLRDVGRPERCLDIDQFDVADLVAAFAKLRAEDGEEERAALRAQAERLCSVVEEQFDRLFGTPPAQPAQPRLGGMAVSALRGRAGRIAWGILGRLPVPWRASLARTMPWMPVLPAFSDARWAYDKALFERFYALPDPWGLSQNKYEHLKYAVTLALCGDGPFERALEIGCGEGLFTSMLAPRCRSLLAVDISSRAVERARERCSDFPQVVCDVLTLPAEYDNGPFDLVVASDVLYFWIPDDLRIAAPCIEGSLEVGGRFVALHYALPVNAVSDGDGVHDRLRELFTLPLISSETREIGPGRLYRIDVWEKR